MIGRGPYFGSSMHMEQCVTAPIIPSVTFGAVFAAIDSFQYGQVPRFQTVGTYMAGIYVYNILQCPMEAIHGRQSLLHNFASGGILGYVGVSSGRLGIPFVDPTFAYRVGRPELVAFGVYGGMAAAFAALGGKRI
jgi:hypothetical protein